MTTRRIWFKLLAVLIRYQGIKLQCWVLSQAKLNPALWWWYGFITYTAWLKPFEKLWSTLKKSLFYKGNFSSNLKQKKNILIFWILNQPANQGERTAGNNSKEKFKNAERKCFIYCICINIATLSLLSIINKIQKGFFVNKKKDYANIIFWNFFLLKTYYDLYRDR